MDGIFYADRGNNLGNGQMDPRICLPLERSGEIEGEAAKADSAVHVGARARTRSANDEGRGVLLKHEECTGVPHAFQPRTAVHRQHLGSARCQKSNLRLASQVRGSAETLHSGSVEGVKIAIQHVNIEDLFADIDTKYPSKHRRRYLFNVKLMFNELKHFS